MARSILKIAQEAARRDATAPEPRTLFGDNNTIAKTLRTAAGDVLREVLRSSRWAGLSEWHSTWVFALQAGRYAYPLPPDFLRSIPMTEQRNGWPMGLVGPASPQVWARWLSGSVTVPAPMGWRIKNNILFIDPTPSADELVTIEYISRYPVVSEIKEGDYNLASQPLQTFAPVVPRDGWMALKDEAVLSHLPGAGEFNYDNPPGYDVGTWGLDPSELLKRINPTSAVGPLPQVRREEFTGDEDKPAVEDDYILSLGMTYHLQRSLGLPYAERAAEFERELDVKLSEDAGGARSFRLGGEACDYEATPLGGGRWMVS